ncbi:MAG: precorrin-3B synthase [Aquabacterium sp.]|nr:precorrin-3B synthase [Aquabacterium sp.]
MPAHPDATKATHAAHIQGWCPGALRPMPSGDGLVLRIRAPLGRLTQAQGQGIADLAARYAQPLLDLTSRANLQLRGIADADYPALLAGLQALGLIDTDINAESRRNLLVSPFWEAGDGTQALAQVLTEALAQPTAPQLPAKFGFALDCGPTPVLRDCSADIRLERHAQGFLVYANGSTRGVVASAECAIARATELAHWFITAGGASFGRGRMAALVAHTPVPAHLASTPVPAAHAACPPWGLVPQGCVVGFEFGQMSVDTLRTLSALSPLRLTPWRSVLVEGAQRVPARPTLITHANDVRLRVSACTGAPGCTQAAAPTRALAQALAPLVPPSHTLHVSGCSKGCAHPHKALTLVATSAGFDLIQHGTAASPPDARDLNPAAIAAHLKQLAHAPHL